MSEPIDTILKYLNNGSARWVTSSEIAIAIYGLSPSASLKGPKVRVQKAMKENIQLLRAGGIKIEVSHLGYRMIK